jgi:hypothetical protein
MCIKTGILIHADARPNWKIHFQLGSTSEPSEIIAVHLLCRRRGD